MATPNITLSRTNVSHNHFPVFIAPRWSVLAPDDLEYQKGTSQLGQWLWHGTREDFNTGWSRVITPQCWHTRNSQRDMKSLHPEATSSIRTSYLRSANTRIVAEELTSLIALSAYRWNRYTAVAIIVRVLARSSFLVSMLSRGGAIEHSSWVLLFWNWLCDLLHVKRISPLQHPLMNQCVSEIDYNSL